jgi:hypothetical protein
MLIVVVRDSPIAKVSPLEKVVLGAVVTVIPGAAGKISSAPSQLAKNNNATNIVAYVKKCFILISIFCEN